MPDDKLSYKVEIDDGRLHEFLSELERLGKEAGKVRDVKMFADIDKAQSIIESINNSVNQIKDKSKLMNSEWNAMAFASDKLQKSMKERVKIMPTIAFDTHAYVKELTNAGFSNDQAEVQVKTLIDALKQIEAHRLDGMASKRDIKEIELKIAEVKRDLELQIAEVKRDLELQIAEVKRDLDVKIAEVKKDIAENIVREKVQ